ncbi:hypothetical protein GCM10028857_03100 [Salinarchaeum chitinilyticum]
MIYSASTLASDPSYNGTEVTVRCTVQDGPKTGDRRGNKTLYEISVSQTEFDRNAFLSFWNEEPEWTDTFGETQPYVRDAVSNVPLETGEVVVARGIPNTNEGKWYFNVTSIIIRQPDTAIGKGEMRTASECPRIYELAFDKNVYSSNSYDLSPGAVKGNIVHDFLEYAVSTKEYRELFRSGWAESDIDQCLEDVLDREYSLKLALCRLAWISTNQIKEHAISAIEPLVNDEKFQNIVSDGNNIEAEIALSDATGFNGRVDLVVDGTPYDFKTHYRVSDSEIDKHRFQLRVYLFAFLLETLKAGESVTEHIEEGVEGQLVYPNRTDVDGVHYERVRLRERDIADILSMRNEAIVLREGFGTSTTFGRDCEGCSFKDPTVIGKGDSEGKKLPSPCKFHCQSERRWDCFETDDTGEVVSQCQLFGECDQRLEYRDPSTTDHFNQLRNALSDEREARMRLGSNLDRLENETLEQAGLRIPELTVDTLDGGQRLILNSDSEVIPSFQPGSNVRLSREDSEYYLSVIYYGKSEDKIIFELDGHPPRGFFDPTATYVATLTLSAAQFPRDLLGQVDYIQRSGISPVLERKNPASDARETLLPTELDVLENCLGSESIYIDVPVRRERLGLITELIEIITSYSYQVPDEERSIPDSEQRVLVLNGVPDLTDDIAEQLSGVSGYVRMDGFADPDTASVTPKMSGHEIYEALESSQVIVSSLHYALSDHVFHGMEDGDKNARTHSEKFFDTVALVGAETLTEPQFHFLSSLADRFVAIGDVHRRGPELVSGNARESSLGEAYFSRAFKHYASVESDNCDSLQVPAELPGEMEDIFSRLDFAAEQIPGSVDFVDAGGEATTAISSTTIEETIPRADEQNEARYIRLEPIESVDALQISYRLEQIRTLDAGDLTIQNEYTLQDIRFRILTNNPIDGDSHQLEVNVPIESTPYLHRHLLQNSAEVETVVDVCQSDQPDIVVTPFVAHANSIRDAFREENMNVPVKLPSELDGNIRNEVVVSTAIADENRAVSPPVSEIETLYTVLSAAQDVTIVGDRTTLERNSVFSSILSDNDVM